MEINCRKFNGYKPCGLSEFCNSACPSRDIVKSRGLIVHLGALGAVARATAILPAIHRKFPGIHLTWVTDAPAQHLLQNNHLIDRVLTSSEEQLLSLSALSFDFAFVIDKSLKAAGILKRVQADFIFGFKADGYTGAILPATPAAEELWQIGLSDKKKFFENKKSEIQLITESLELDWKQDSYFIPLTKEESRSAFLKKMDWSQQGSKILVGLNTGCAPTINEKKLSIRSQRELIQRMISEFKNIQIVLLGGPEDTERNQEIAFGLPVMSSATQKGLRDGLTSIKAMDIVITGDSLGMHMAIAMGAYTIAWFGPTCDHEIELYGRGELIKSPMACSPCWKRDCRLNIKCNDSFPIETFIKALKKAFELPIYKENDL